MATLPRVVAWDGFVNARDLGGLPISDGGSTITGRVWRSAALTEVTAAGWAEARAAGVSAVLDLRDANEIALDPSNAVPPAGFARVDVALDDAGDTAFWARMREANIDGTPLYLEPFLAEKPALVAAALRGLLRAADGGGVLVHCVGGRDRTGLVSLVLLSLAGVLPNVIADDYVLSAAANEAWSEAHGFPSETAAIERIMSEHGTTLHAAVVAVAAGFDAVDYLGAAGLSPAEVDALRDLLR